MRAAMVLAAGLGTRMRPLTDARPKALLTVAGRSLLDRALDHARDWGATRAVVNVHHFADQMRAALAGRRDLEVVISDETDALLETGGGVLRALPLLGPAPFLTLNADAVWTGASPVAPLAAGPAEGDGALMLLARRTAAMAYGRPGDFDLIDGRPARRAGAVADWVYTGAQVLRPAALAGAPSGPFSLNLVWNGLLAEGRLAAALHPGGWVDVGTPAGLAAAEVALA